jgi:Fibronectin type III domain
MASPSVLQSAYAIYFSASSGTVSLSDSLVAGDVVLVLADTNNGAQVSGVHEPTLGTFTHIGTGFSMSVWAAQAAAPVAGPIVPTLTYGTAFNTTSIIGAIIRGATLGATLAAAFDPNPSLPGVETGNPAPSPVTFSTSLPDDLLLLCFGMFVGFGGGPWEDPSVFPPNTIGPDAWNWENGVNNTELLQPIALALYSRSVSSTQTNAMVSSSSGALMGAAYLVTALTADTQAPDVPTGESCGTNTTSSITAQWVAPSGGPVTSYTLQWRLVGAVSWTTITGIIGTSQIISGLLPGEQVEWQVQAVGAGGTSAFSASTICATQGIAPNVFEPQSLGIWRGQVGINWRGLALVGDAFTGVIGRSDFQNFTEYGNVMRLLVTSPPIQQDRKRIFMPRFEIDVQVGDGVQDNPEQAPQMMLDYSRDGGMTWSPVQKWRSMGKVGEYMTRLRWMNMGRSRSWVLRLTCTDVVRRQIIGAYADWYTGQG